MTNGPDEQQPGQQPPPPPPPPPSAGGRGLFARNNPDEPSPPPPPQRPQPSRQEPPRQPPPPREDVRQRQTPPESNENPFLLPNERERQPVYGASTLPVVPLALMVLAIVVGAALFLMSRGDKKQTGITPQQAANSLVLHLDGLDMTEDAFRREIATGIKKGRVPCDKLAGQPPDNIAAGLKLGALKMEVPSASGVAAKNGQKADDASLLVAAKVVLDSCPKAPAQQQQQQLPPQNPPGGQTNPPGNQPSQPGTNPPGGNQPAPAGTQAPAPGTARPTTPSAPATTPRP